MTAFILSVLSSLQNFITTRLPDFSLASSTVSSVSSGFESVIEFIAQVNFFIPLPTILLILSIVYGIKLSKFSLFLVNWIIRRLADFIP